MKCSNCNNDIDHKMKFCPNCGIETHIPSKEEIESLSNFLKKRITEPIDASPQGLLKTLAYLSLVSENLTQFGNLLLSLININDEIKKNPSLRKNKEFLLNAKTLIVGMSLKATSLSFESPNQQIVSGIDDFFNHPPGCQIVARKLHNIGKSTGEFMEIYDQYLSSGNRNHLISSAAVIKKVSESLDLALEEVNKTHDQVSKIRNAKR